MLARAHLRDGKRGPQRDLRPGDAHQGRQLRRLVERGDALDADHRALLLGLEVDDVDDGDEGEQGHAHEHEGHGVGHG